MITPSVSWIATDVGFVWVTSSITPLATVT